MKALKISLVVIVVAAISAGIFFWIQSTKEPDKVKAPENQFTRKIEQEIEQLKAKPDSKFCKDFYKEVAYHIDDFFKQNRFGNNPSENDQWKENLEKNLYSAYADKFIKQAFYAFRNSKWKSEDLKFIQAEKNALKKSKLLITGSPVYKEFTKIQTVLDKYYEIVDFISSCEDFSYSGSNLADRFPIAEVQSKIQIAASLRKDRLENEYVNNCTRLHDGLKNIPQSLFYNHVLYLENKMKYWSNMWCNYNSHKDYSQNLNAPLKSEINDFGNSTIYSGVNVDAQYERLSEEWSRDNQNAYNATYPCDKN